MPLPDPPLTTDELIALLERSYNETVELLGSLIGKSLSTLLFIREALIVGDIGGNKLFSDQEDQSQVYCSTDDGIGEIIEMLTPYLAKGWNRTDEASLKVRRAVDSYRKNLPKGASV